VPEYLPTSLRTGTRMMIFVDGENLAIRYKALLEDRTPPTHVSFEKDVAVWSHHLNPQAHGIETIRKYYYTSVSQDEPRRHEIEDFLKGAGIEAPRVFAKTKGKRSKRVDVSLTTEMLTHAHRDNYDLGVLVAGDEDYVPLIEAVMAEGKRVSVWFFEANAGLSPVLKRTADHFFDIGHVLMEFDPRQLAYFHM
jgi:uncharacterized LabA/DUF88 family protein